MPVLTYAYRLVEACKLEKALASMQALNLRAPAKPMTVSPAPVRPARLAVRVRAEEGNISHKGAHDS